MTDTDTDTDTDICEYPCASPSDCASDEICNGVICVK
jgi:hypothetical protein